MIVRMTWLHYEKLSIIKVENSNYYLPHSNDFTAKTCTLTLEALKGLFKLCKC